MRISDWSSDVCSSDLGALGRQQAKEGEAEGGLAGAALAHDADGVALAHGNRYAVDGAHMIDGALQHAFLDREPDFHVVTLHDHRRIGRATDRKSTRLNSSH